MPSRQRFSPVHLPHAAGIGLLLLASLPALGATVHRQVALMGTVATLTVDGDDRTAALAASEGLLRALEEAEAELSTWRPASLLSRLNRSPLGVPLPLPAAVERELAAAWRCRTLTGGAFEPAVGPLVAAWDLQGAGRVPTGAELDAALASSAAEAILLLPGAAMRRLPGAAIDSGGFGKGAALDRSLSGWSDRDASIRSVALDLGGQLAVRGGERFVDLADPEDRSHAVLRLRIGDGSVATSGNSERRRVVGGRAVGHLLDPRSGQPAADFGSVTVWAPNALLADCLATGLFVRGAESAIAWPERPAGVEVLALERTGDRWRATASAGWRGRLLPLDDRLQIVILDSPEGGPGGRLPRGDERPVDARVGRPR